MSRSDLIGPRPLRPPSSPVQHMISFMGTEQAPLQEGVVIGTQTIQGAYHGVMPGLHAPPPPLPPQPSLYIEKAVAPLVPPVAVMIPHPQGQALEAHPSVVKSMIDQMIESYPFPEALQQHAECLSKAEAAVAGQDPEGHLKTPEMQLAKQQAAVVHLTERGHAHRNVGDHAKANHFFTAANKHQGNVDLMSKQGVQLKGGEHEAWMDHYRQNPGKHKGHAGGDAVDRAGAHLIASAEPPQEFFTARHSMAHPGQKIDPAKTEAGLQQLRTEARGRKGGTASGRIEQTMVGGFHPGGEKKAPAAVSPVGTAAHPQAAGPHMPALGKEHVAPTPAGRQGTVTNIPTAATGKPSQSFAPRGAIQAAPAQAIGGEAGTFVGKKPTAKALAIILPPEGSEPLGKPIPKREKGESKKEYASDVISMMHHEGKPHKQAIAIGLRQAGLARKSIPLLLMIKEESCCAHAVVS